MRGGNPWQMPKVAVTPDVGGDPRATQRFGDVINDVSYLLVTANAVADAIAAQRFIDGDPDLVTINPGANGGLLSNTDLTTIHVVAIGNATSGSLAPGEIVTLGDSRANFMRAQIRFDFATTDHVKSVQIQTSLAAFSLLYATVMGFDHGQ